MQVLKCKMCGGSVTVEPGQSIGECEYCGSVQTLTKTQDETIINLYNRANNLRLKCEFDKAGAVYEKIVEADDAEAEAHWGIVLCKYGIEYVEDPKSHARIPTCHRTLYDAITKDADYLAAIDYSDPAQQEIYEKEARAIDRIQRDILAIVKNEKPFDVFLCYKETGADGKRTIDSTLANDIYYQLTQEGFKVFYAAITLEDKLGQEYEPYIFAALNSAKVMLVIGTKPEHFNAVWVKNEWSRFLSLMKTDRSKTLIPCYRDMDAYDLPEEFAHLQAQDMSKIGFIPDLVRGIKKLIVKEEPKPTAAPVYAPAPAAAPSTAPGNVMPAAPSAPFSIAPLLKRAFLFLEDKEWNSADAYCEKVLDQDPENAQAYLGKLMAELKVCRLEDLKNHPVPFENNHNYKNIIRFDDSDLVETLNGYISSIKERIENERMTRIYNAAQNEIKLADSGEKFQKIVNQLAMIPGFRDADRLAQQCRENAEKCRKDEIYLSARAKMVGENIAFYEEALNSFQKILNWKDTDAQIEICQEMIEELRKRKIESDIYKAFKREKSRKKQKKYMCVFIAIILVVGILLFDINSNISKSKFEYETIDSNTIAITHYHGSSTRIKIPKKINGKIVTLIDDYAFFGCNDLEKIIIPQSVTSIGDGAFGNCTSLTRITIPAEVTSLGAYAFSECTNLKSISIPNSVKSIGDSAFMNCKNLRNINYHGTKQSWENIIKGNQWASKIFSLTIHCTDGDIT